MVNPIPKDMAFLRFYFSKTLIYYLQTLIVTFHIRLRFQWGVNHSRSTFRTKYIAILRFDDFIDGPQIRADRKIFNNYSMRFNDFAYNT